MREISPLRPLVLCWMSLIIDQGENTLRKTFNLVLKKSRKIFSNVEEKDREESAGGEERGRGVLMSSTIEEIANCGDTFVPNNLRLDLGKRNNKRPIIHVIYRHEGPGQMKGSSPSRIVPPLE